ncbi:MAG TPA: hypothetical protein PKY70_16680 [Nakamurella multipartita]|nr:hypothetical protein [Nakamurella multipartita]
MTTVVALTRHPEWVRSSRGSMDRPHPWRLWVVAVALGVVSLVLLGPSIWTRAGGLAIAQGGSALVAFAIFVYLAHRGPARSTTAAGSTPAHPEL